MLYHIMLLINKYFTILIICKSQKYFTMKHTFINSFIFLFINFFYFKKMLFNI